LCVGLFASEVWPSATSPAHYLSRRTSLHVRFTWAVILAMSAAMTDRSIIFSTRNEDEWFLE